MRIFLTGATGYIGSAVLDALLRGGHEVTALVRDPEKAERVSRRGVQPVIGELSKPASYAAAAEGADAIVHTALDSSKRGQKVDRQAIDTLLAAAARRAAAGHPRSFVYTSGVWVLGDTQDARPRKRPGQPDAARRLAAGARAAGARRAGATASARSSCGPAIVYGGARGIIGDLLKDAANGLVRVVGDGQNHWPCIYDRDLADLYVRVATHGRCVRHLPRQRRSRRARRRHRRGDRPSREDARPTCGTCRSTRRGRRWGRTPTRWRSIRSCAARAPARSAGRRRCTRWPATSRGCSKSSEPPAKPPRRSNGSPIRLYPSTIPSINPYSSAFCRVEIEVRALGVADDLLQRPARSLGEDLVDLRLHLLQAIEVLRRGGRRLPARPLRRLVNHDPRVRQRQPASFAGRLQHDRAHRIRHPLHDDRHLDAAARRAAGSSREWRGRR